MKRAIVIYIGNVLHCPPALSLVQILNNLEIETHLITVENDDKTISYSIGDAKNVRFAFVSKNYKNDTSVLIKLLRMFVIRHKIWKYIDNIYDNETIIWIVSEGSVKHVGNRITKYNYILHLLELNEGIYYLSGNPILKMNYKMIAKKARVVVEAEYNRAHITKAWWGLDKLPMIYPNKPFNIININKRSTITSNEEIKETIEKIKNKKIVLYQGNMSKERPLLPFIEAVCELGEEYAFVMMINGDNTYTELKYENFYCLPFIAPPHHLEVTSHAFIGVLSYSPVKNDYSILNTLFCAPNKIWEYSKFGIPMISNDLPALRMINYEFNNLVVVDDVSKENIKKAILKINDNYQLYSNNSKLFYESINMVDVVKNILSKSEKNES